jgi:hypothetical protein
MGSGILPITKAQFTTAPCFYKEDLIFPYQAPDLCGADIRAGRVGQWMPFLACLFLNRYTEHYPDDKPVDVIYPTYRLSSGKAGASWIAV